MRALLWAVTGLLGFPLLVVQGRWARMRTPRLPEANGATTGTAGEGPVLRLAVIGESPVAGVGVATYEDALAAQLARCLASGLGRKVEWIALGENGADAAGVIGRLLPKLRPCDYALIVMGVNDTTHFTRLSRWRAHMAQLIAGVKRVCTGPVLVAGVPPMHLFTALPQPLRWWIGLRAQILDADLRRVATAADAAYCAVPALLESAHLASDGYHPSAQGCAQWAEHIASACGQAR
jgi:lysophospholipase L1-like esterase